MDLDLKGKTRFVDSETNEIIEVYPEMIKDQYNALIKSHFKKVKNVPLKVLSLLSINQDYHFQIVNSSSALILISS